MNLKTNAISDVENWLLNAFQTVVAWITGAQSKLSGFITLAENVLNALKNFDASVEGKTIESVIEALIPASTGLIYAFFNQLPVWLSALNLIEQDFINKPLTAIWAEAQTNLIAMKNADADSYAGTMNTLKANFAKFFATNGGAALNIQQALTLGQPTHNLELVTGQPVGD